MLVIIWEIGIYFLVFSKMEVISFFMIVIFVYIDEHLEIFSCHTLDIYYH